MPGGLFTLIGHHVAVLFFHRIAHDDVFKVVIMRAMIPTLNAYFNIEDKASRIVACLEARDFSQAEKLCNSMLTSGNNIPRLQFLLGAALEGLGELTSALEAFENALATDPNDVQCWAAKLSVLSKLQRLEEASETANLASQQHPRSAFLKANLGNILSQQNRFPEALEAYRQALLINPQEPAALIHMSSVLVKMGQHELAIAQASIASKVLPGNTEILNNLAEAHIQLHRYHTALEICENALKISPYHAVIHFKRALVLSYLQRYDEARHAFAHARSIDPQIADAYYPQLAGDALGRGITTIPELIFFDVAYHQQLRCNWTYREEYIQGLHDILLNHAADRKPATMAALAFQMLSLPIDGQNRLTLVRQVADLYADGVSQVQLPPSEKPNRDSSTIRIGYVSPDFRLHPVGLLSRLIYQLHDRQQFEIYAYSLHKPEKQPDKVNTHIARTCDVFRDVSEFLFTDIAKKIREDDIDILIDMAGYTTYACPEIFALRSAPVQIAYLGYPGTSGASFMDYAIVDHTIVPEQGKEDWTEQLIRLPNAHCPYDCELDNSPINNSREDFGLPRESTVLCCFNNSYKIEPGIFSIWMSILRATPRSVLWILGLHEDTKKNLLASAASAGIDAERLIFAGLLPHEEHIKRYQLADIFLDTCWHNAHTTAADALWQGLPVLTCQGSVASSRLASSLLHALDLQDELVAHDLNEYQKKAIFYALSKHSLNEVKQKLAVNRFSQPLFNTALTVKHLEQGYLAAWERHQAGLPPAAMDIADIRRNGH